MSTQQKIKQYGQRWLALACLGSLGWLGLSVPQVPARAQASQQMCIDNIGFYHRNQVTVRANWGREALRKDRIQPAADHLAKALDFARAIKDVESRSLIYEDFIATNSGSTGWLVHEVNRLIELDQTVAVRTVLVPARRAAEELPTGYSSLKIRMLTTIANHYTAIGDRATALDLLSQARQLVTHVQGTEIKANILTTLAQSYGTAGDSTIATEVVTDALQQAEKVEYGDSSRRDQTIAPIAVVYAEAGNIEQAMTLAQSLEQPYYRENSIGAAALAAARLGQLDRATELVQLLTLEQPLIRTLTEIGLQLAETGDTDQSQQYFDQAIKVIQTEGYPGPSFTNAMVNAGFTETVLAALSAAPEGRITVDGLLDLAQHHTEAGNSKAAGNVLRQAMVAVDTIEQDYARDEVLEDILKRATVIADYDLAIATIDKLVVIKQQGGSTIFTPAWAYGSVARAAAQSGQIELALDVIERIELDRMQIKRRAWVDVAVAYAKAGDLDAAFAMAEKTKDPYSSNYALALVRIGLQQREAGQVEDSAATIGQAIRAAETMESSRNRLEALNVVALEQAKAGLTTTDLLPSILTMFRQQAVDLEGSFTLQELVSGWVEIGEYDIALQFFDIIAETQPQNPLWRTLLLERLIQTEDYGAALELLDSRELSYQGMDELLQLADRYFQLGQTDLAVQILARVYGDPKVGPSQLLRIVELYTQAEQTDRVLPVLDRAYEVAQTIPGDESKMLVIREDLIVDDNNDRGSVYGDIAVAYGRVGAFEQGMAVAEALQGREAREEAINRLNCYRDF